MSTLDLANDLMDRVLLASGEGDWAPYFIPSEVRFKAGQTAALKLVFNVPADADFYGECINAFLQYRVLDTVTPGQSDITFRPCNWTCIANIANENHLQEANATAMVRLKSSAIYSNPIDIGLFFSTPVGTSAADRGTPLTMYPGGMDADDVMIHAGTTAEIDLSPVFSSSVVILAGLSTDFEAEFRVVGVFQGRKNVRAFR